MNKLFIFFLLLLALSCADSQNKSVEVNAQLPKKSLTPAQRATQDQLYKQVDNLEISEIIDGGNRIILSDGSKWDVDPIDSDKSSGWIEPAEISVTNGDNIKYPYKIFNKWTNDSVNARIVQSEQ